MNTQSYNSLTKALDVAIARVVSECFDEFSSDLEPDIVTENIRHALNGFEGLKYGFMPSYNDKWIALLYLTRYQPGHINLAFTLARYMMENNREKIVQSGRLNVFDFGCGALAMQFGLALAAANILNDSSPPVQITIEGEDTSQSMKEIGKRIWKAFLRELDRASDDPSLIRVREMCKYVKLCTLEDAETIPTWLTVLHVAYEKGRDEREARLFQILGKHEPDLVLVTSHANKRSDKSAFVPGLKSGIVLHRYHREKTTYPKEHWSKDKLMLNGLCESISKVKWKIRDKLVFPHHHSLFREVGSVKKSLTSPIYWHSLPDSYAKLYTRGDKVG